MFVVLKRPGVTNNKKVKFERRGDRQATGLAPHTGHRPFPCGPWDRGS